MPFKQDRNDELIDNLRSEVQMRYEPQFAWKSVCSQFLAPTAVRAFWPMSVLDYTNPRVTDISGNGYDLTDNLLPRYGTDGLAPYVVLNGTNEYLSRADGGVGNWADITGTEGWIETALLGLTICGWYRFTDALGTVEYMMSKWDAAGNERSYRLQRAVGGTVRFSISTDGTAIVNVATTGTPAAGEWFFGAARYTKDAAELDVWYNSEVVNLAAGVPASIHSGTADFNLGARHNGLELMAGRLSCQFLCAAALPNAVVSQLYHQSRALFGV